MRKRSRGTGRDGRQRWELRWNVADPATDERKEIYETFFGGAKEADKRLRERQAEIDREGKGFVLPAKETVAGYLAGWLKHKSKELRPSTTESYGRMIRCHIVPAIGALPLADVTPAAVQKMIDDMRSGEGPEERAASPRTCAYVRTVLRIALQDAVRLRQLPSNPVNNSRAPKQAPRQVTAFTVDQGETLFERAATTRLAPLLRFAFYSGLRRGEVLGLRWDDVDRGKWTVAVRRSRVVVAGKGVTQDPKTEAGVRTVTVPAPAVEALRAQWALRAKDKLAAGERWREGDWVFATETGGALNPNNVSRDFRRLRDAAGLPPLPFHALRHTAVSMQLAAGVALEIVSKKIGHKRVGLTADTYGHLLPEADREATDKLDAWVAQQKAGNEGEK